LSAADDYTEDTIEAFKADLAAEPDADAYLREELHRQAEDFLRLCVKCAKYIELLDDVWKAQEVMLDVTVWAKELSVRLGKEVVVKKRAKNTVGAFKR
jgi:hypothetical protein